MGSMSIGHAYEHGEIIGSARKAEIDTHVELDVFDGSLSGAANHFRKQLEQQENINTGLVIGAEESWQFSVFIFVGSLVVRQADGDIRRLLKDF